MKKKKKKRTLQIYRAWGGIMDHRTFLASSWRSSLLRLNLPLQTEISVPFFTQSLALIPVLHLPTSTPCLLHQMLSQTHHWPPQGSTSEIFPGSSRVGSPPSQGSHPRPLSRGYHSAPKLFSNHWSCLISTLNFKPLRIRNVARIAPCTYIEEV